LLSSRNEGRNDLLEQPGVGMAGVAKKDRRAPFPQRQAQPEFGGKTIKNLPLRQDIKKNYVKKFTQASDFLLTMACLCPKRARKG
jgi:hypothetical protein